MNNSYTFDELNYEIDEDAPYDLVIDSAYQLFIKELTGLNSGELYQKIKTTNTQVLELLCQLNIDKLFISITTSKSLFYRFSVANFPFEFKLEVFFDVNTQFDDLTEAILHVYKSQIKQGSFYGTFNDLTDIINSYMPDKYFAFEFEMI